MITSPKIEQLAFQGKCRWVVFWTGYTSTYTIPCPEGGFILLRNIHWNPFYSGANRDEQLLGTAHQLSIVEQGSKTELIYQFRDSVNQITTTNGLGAVHNVPANGPQIIETWGTYKQNLCIDLMQVPDVRTMTYGVATSLLPQAQERPIPLGYGATALTPYIDFSASAHYYPTGQKRPFTGAVFPSIAGVKDGLRYDFTATSPIPAPANDIDRQFQYPIVGFGCWIFNIPISEYLNY